jgi:hypothetical protein
VALQDIDPVFMLQPAVVIVVCTLLLVYWHRRRGFDPVVLAYSFIAYAVAIAMKYAVQLPTIGVATSHFGQQSVGLGIYYGAQTVFFEVGMAYLVASYAVRKGKLGVKDAEGYGGGLAFWENAAVLGALPLINLAAYYAILSTNTPLAQTVYNLLSQNSPGLFEPVSRALGSVALGTLERFSSILLHFAWGYLCVMAAVYSRHRLLLTALPMGFVDFLVPFANTIGDVVFEGLVFTIGVAAVFVAWQAVKQVRAEVERSSAPGGQA